MSETGPNGEHLNGDARVPTEEEARAQAPVLVTPPPTPSDESGGPPSTPEARDEVEAQTAPESSEGEKPSPDEVEAAKAEAADEDAPAAAEEAAEAVPEASEAATEETPAPVEAASPAERPAEEPKPEPQKPALPYFEEGPRKRQQLASLALLRLDKVEEDTAFRMRPEGDIDTLATSLARLGQLFPIDLRLRPPDRFQIITGFRRVAALRLLKRERVLARVHTNLSDGDALLIAVADLLEHRGATKEELEAARDRLDGLGMLTPQARDVLDRAIHPPDEELAPELREGEEEEVDLDELTQDVMGRMALLNQDLALIAELWNALDGNQREALLEQLRYPSQLATYLEGLK